MKTVEQRVTSRYREATGDEFLTVEEVADICGKCAFSMVTAGVAGIYRSDLDRMIEAKGWSNLPKGWTQESVKKFWSSLTGERKHKVTACIKKMEGSGVDDPGAFCASLADKMEPGWRKEAVDHRELFDYLRQEGWTVREQPRVPHAISPGRDYHLWFKPHDVYGVGGLGGLFHVGIEEARPLRLDVEALTPPQFEKEVSRRLGSRTAGGAGDCYEANGQYFMGEAVFPGSNKTLRLVHGEVAGQGPLEGTNYGHAWVEDGGTVIDVSNGRNLRMPKATYYAMGQIDRINNMHVYTAERFRRRVLDSGHWGPWDLQTSTGH